MIGKRAAGGGEGARPGREGGEEGSRFLDRLRPLFSWLETAGFWPTFAATAVILGILLFPAEWTGNEVNYFGLAHRQVSPEDYGPYHAIFDHTNARFLSYSLLGGLVELVGFDAALILARIAVIFGFAAALAHLGRVFGFAAIDVAAGLALFIFGLGQALFGGEWIFFGIEAKVLAYLCVLVAIAAAWQGKWLLLCAFAALGTYFHFLVGGFWAAFSLLLLYTAHREPRTLAKAFALYAAAVLPLAALIALERFGGPPVDGVVHGRSLEWIYAEFRVAHHVAPFQSFADFQLWVPGIAALLGLTGLTALLSVYRREYRLQPLVLCLLLVYLYLLGAFALAFLDRETHHLAAFYPFRPNSLALLLTIFVGLDFARRQLAAGARREWSVGLAALTLILLGEPASRTLAKAALEPGFPPHASLSSDAKDLIRWIGENTSPDDVVLIAGSGVGTTMDAGWLAFERYAGRPTLVNFKFNPTSQADLAEWYRRVIYAREVLGGNCTIVERYPVDFILVPPEPELSAGLGDLAQCGTEVFDAGDGRIIRVGNAGSSRPPPADRAS